MEEAASNSGTVTDVESDSGFCIEVYSELQSTVVLEKMDSVEIEEKWERDKVNEEKQRGSMEDNKMQVDLGLVQEKAERQSSSHWSRSLHVTLQPVESWDHVRISLEEVQKYHRFSCYCQWMCDEIMQLDSSPLRAADITPELRRQFAFLSGGRGDNGSPIIIFPEFPSFSEITDREFHNVLTYLTSVPSLPSTDVGFILVIDRRQDRWAAVKGTLLRIAGAFPGNLQLVLVLRPTTLFQRTLSDILFKFNKDEFKMKVPVIMLSSVSELHSYIDQTQLSQDLGGTQAYCHEKWITHRTAIEGFALMVKKMAQALQSFGAELAETELPNETQATNFLLSEHGCKKDKMKDDLLVALRQGSRLLESINEPLMHNPDHNMNQDELENLATVQRLLSQLDETETAFDEFWAKHRTKLEQCLQLRHFEDDYKELRLLLDQLTEKLDTFSEVGISPTHVDHILSGLNAHEERVCEVLDRALALAREGDDLIQKAHYAQDSIVPKSNELRTLCQELSDSLKSKKELLLKVRELHHCLEKALKWCDDGIYLLASQPVDKCQSHEGAESALQELERFLADAGQNRLLEPSGIWTEYEAVLDQQLRDQVEKVFQKQASMQEMFDKRRVSLNKLAAKQTRPVQPVAPRPEAFIKSPLSSPAHRGKLDRSHSEGNNATYEKGDEHLQNGEIKRRHGSLSEEEENLAVLRRHVMNELLETERAYVEELLCVLQGYASEMDNAAMAHLIPPHLLNKKEILFGNMPEIYHFHKRTFLRELELYADCPELVGRCFLERMTDLQIYEKYCHNKPRSESLWRQCSDCIFFQVLSTFKPGYFWLVCLTSLFHTLQQECQKKLEHKLGLDSYLLKPVQRITKYQLLLKEMLKYSKGCEGTDDLQEALTSILGILKAVNDSMHLIAITGYEGNLSELGKLLMQGSFSVWTEHKKGHAKVKDLARFKPMQRHIFLHEKALLFCKRREESGEGYEKAPSYSFKQSLSMNAVGITENAKGDNKKFEIWCNSREEVYIVQAPTPEVKTTWVKEIRKVLTTQLEACREASQQRAPDQVIQCPPGGPDNQSSPFKMGQRSLKKGDERKAEQCILDSNSSPSSKSAGKERASSPTSDRSAAAKKRFTLQGFSNLKAQKEPPNTDDKSFTLPITILLCPGSPTSPDHKTKRQSDPTPFGFKGWNKTSLSLDASEEHEGYSSGEDPLNSDAEEDNAKKLCAGKYTATADYEKSSNQDVAVKSGEVVQLVKEGEDGQWLVRNLNTSTEGWIATANLITLIVKSKSCHSLTSSEGSGSGHLSTSSSCSETCTPFTDVKS
ncbi:guanine nucleotide exchange factor DBS-like isoform X2 [Corythoichthys intestinalis]|uniref:guanine nucleotide exchange factor DBS-like isoform X2 n=1 Tax=Corythoichthys intestinalis TaxID=161448 RepID=UPI0025A5A6F8|nr:guanine nucleotide exchange factor DBS-like isoform X2 [Corythoichthys intestinalis]